MPNRPANLRRDIYDLIVDRLRARNVCAVPQTHNDIDFLLPTTTAASSIDRDLWSRLSRTSFLVSDAELNTAFSLSKCTKISPKPSNGAYSLYIRSFRVSIDELDEILQRMEDLGMIYSKDKEQRLREWKARIPKGQQHVWIRYAGQTKTTAWKRHEGDLRAPAVTFAISFLRVLQDHFEVIVKAATVFEFNATQLYQQSSADLGEQAVIALLWSGLLNQQWGGAGIGYNVSANDIEIFRILNTDFVAAISDFGSIFNEGEAEEYITRLRDYYDQYVDHKATRPFTDGLHGVYVQQLQAQSLTAESQCSLALIVRSDNTVQAFNNAEAFLRGSGKTSTLMRHFFSSMAAAEDHQGTVLLDRVEHILTHFQFTDVFPWPAKKKDDLVQLVKIHRDYVKVSKPLVVLPLSDRISAIVWNGLSEEFVSKFTFSGNTAAFDGKHFKDVVGEPHIRKLDGTDQYYICIPCYHAGKMAKMSSEGQQLYGKVMFRNLTVFWLTAETIATLTKRTQPSPSLEFCSKVVDIVKQRLETFNFHAAFTQDRKRLSDFFTEQLKGQAQGHVARVAANSARERQSFTKVEDFDLGGEQILPSFYKGGQGWIKISNRSANVDKSLANRKFDDANSADPLWFFTKFFARVFNCQGYPDTTRTIDLGHPELVETSIWHQLQKFCKLSPYVNHPLIEEIKSFCEFKQEKRNGGDHTLSVIAMQRILLKLFPRADLYKENFYVDGATHDNKSMKSMVLVPGQSSSFAGFIKSDLDKKGVLRAEKRPMLEGDGPVQKKAKKGTSIYRSGRRGREPLGLSS